MGLVFAGDSVVKQTINIYIDQLCNYQELITYADDKAYLNETRNSNKKKQISVEYSG
jgi:hypothetical protein